MAAPPPRIAAVVRHVAWVGIAAHASFVPMFASGGHPRLAAGKAEGRNRVVRAAWSG